MTSAPTRSSTPRPPSTPTSEPLVLRVAPEAANVRPCPEVSEACPPVTVLLRCEAVEVERESAGDTWLRVRLPGRPGPLYMHESVLTGGACGDAQAGAATAPPAVSQRSASPMPPVVTEEEEQRPQETGERAVVTFVVDGDTIEVETNNATHRVRYIGINTPEWDQPGGAEATAVNRSLVEGRTVRLEPDISETDPYGRLLRYVYVGELFVNAELVRRGFGQAATYPPDVRHAELFVQLEREAREGRRGLWAEARPQESVPPTQPPGMDLPSDCDPSYPDVCIARYPPDLDCAEIPFRRFRVVGPDPHGFDRDRDGIGCER